MQEVFEKIIEKLRTEKEMDRSKVYSAEQCDAIRYSFGAAIDVVKAEAAEYNNGWIPVKKRLPTKEEYLKNDGRFVLDDGNRRYQGMFDIYDRKFKFLSQINGIRYELCEDNCVIAWQPLPEPYQKGE